MNDNLNAGDALVLFIIVALIIIIRWWPEITAWYKERRRARLRARNAAHKAMVQSMNEYERQRKQMVKL